VASGGGRSKALDKTLAAYKEELRGVDIWLRSADVTVAAQLFEGTSLRDVAKDVTVGTYLEVVGKDHPHYAKLSGVDKSTQLFEAAKGLDIAKVDVMHAMSAKALTQHAEDKKLKAFLSERITKGTVEKNVGDAQGIPVKNPFEGLEVRPLKLRGKSLDIKKNPECVRGWLQAIGKKGSGITVNDVHEVSKALLKATPEYDDMVALKTAIDTHESSLNQHIEALEAIQRKEENLGGKPSADLQRGIDALKAERTGLQLLRVGQQNLAAHKILSSKEGKIALNTTFLETIPLQKTITGTEATRLNQLLLTETQRNPEASLGAVYKRGALLPVYAFALLPVEKQAELRGVRTRAAALIPPAQPQQARAVVAGPQGQPEAAARPVQPQKAPVMYDPVIVDEEEDVAVHPEVARNQVVPQQDEDDLLDGLERLFTESRADDSEIVNQNLIRLAQENNIPLDIPEEIAPVVPEEVQRYAALEPQVLDSNEEVLLEDFIVIPLPEDLEALPDSNAKTEPTTLPSLATMHSKKAEVCAKTLKESGAYPDIPDQSLKTIAEAYVQAEHIKLASAAIKDIGRSISSALNTVTQGTDPEDALKSLLGAIERSTSTYNNEAILAAYGPGMAAVLPGIPQEDKEMIGNAFAYKYLRSEALDAWMAAGDHVVDVYASDVISPEVASHALAELQIATLKLINEAEESVKNIYERASSIEQALVNPNAASGAPVAPPPPPAGPPPPPPPSAAGGPVVFSGKIDIAGGKDNLKKAVVSAPQPQNQQSDLLDSIRKGTSLRVTQQAIKETQEKKASDSGLGFFNMDLLMRRSEEPTAASIGDEDDSWGDEDW
jgi:hypothetical protein